MSGLGNILNQGGQSCHGHQHHGKHDAAAAKGSECGPSEGGQGDPAQMFQHIMQQLKHEQG